MLEDASTYKETSVNPDMKIMKELKKLVDREDTGLTKAELDFILNLKKHQQFIWTPKDLQIKTNKKYNQEQEHQSSDTIKPRRSPIPLNSGRTKLPNKPPEQPN